jgi:uncharacterized membrane protein
MSSVTTVVGILAVLGAGLIAGVFFAFSSFVMKALARLPAAQGIGAMQAINVVVLNPWFLGAFMGTAVLSLVMIVLALLQWDQSAAVFQLAAGMSYLIGTFLVTLFGNVPLNNGLAARPAGSASSVPEWERYLDEWTRLNHVRSAAAAVATLLFLLGLIQAGG